MQMRVLIVGGGIGGMRAAIKLRKLRPELDVAIIDGDDCFTFIPAIYKIAAGRMAETAVCTPHAVALSGRRIRFIHDSAVGINLRKRTVRTARGELLPYDYMVVASGSRTDYYKIPGMESNSFAIKTRDDAEKLDEHISEIMRSGRKARFAICGGGLTGIEFATELDERLRQPAGESGPAPEGRYSITLIHAGARLLPEVPAAQEIAEENLRGRGIKLILGQPAIKAGVRGVTIANGRTVPADTIIWAGGTRPSELAEKSGLRIITGAGGRATAGGGIAVNEFLQTKSDSRVYAVGDCISFQHGSQPAIKTAINAFLQAEVAAGNIARQIQGKPLKAYEPLLNPVMFTLGDTGVIAYKSILLHGRWAAALKGLIEKLYAKQMWIW